MIKDYFSYQGTNEITGSRDAFRIAFNRGLIDNGAVWMNMIESRIKSSHAYNEEVAKEILIAIKTKYIEEFIKLEKTLNK